MDPSIKSLTITGPAVEDAMKSRRPSRRKVKKSYETDEMEDSISADPYVPVKPVAPIIVTPVVTAPPAPPATIPVKPNVVPLAPTTPFTGGTISKITLNPPKAPRIKLQPKIVQKPIAKSAVSQTRKARRIHLTVSNLNHRFTRAKRVTESTAKESIDTIREYLTKKGVIQTKSKAPEKMLRSMYNDFMLLKDPTL
jgi:hypothetical protein